MLNATTTNHSDPPIREVTLGQAGDHSDAPIRTGPHSAADRLRPLVAKLVICDRLVSHRYSFGTASSGPPPRPLHWRTRLPSHCRGPRDRSGCRTCVCCLRGCVVSCIILLYAARRAMAATALLRRFFLHLFFRKPRNAKSSCWGCPSFAIPFRPRKC